MPGETRTETRTLCPYCGVGCGLIARTEGGRLEQVEGDPLYPVNHGRTCRKPLELSHAVHARDRATVPLVRERRDVRFREAGWDEAMPSLAARLEAIISEHGPDSVAFYVSGQLLTEDYYAWNKLVKGYLATNNLDSNSRLCMSSAVAGYKGAFGSDGPPPAYADLGLADTFLLLGTNTAACHPIVWSRIRDRLAEGAFAVCADPRLTATARECGLHLPVRPGTDLALLNAMLHVIERDGLIDEQHVRRHTSGIEDALAVAREWTPERAQEVCGVPAADIEHAARRFAGPGRAMVLWSMGANQSTVGTLKNRALINLCLASGQIGRPGTGPLSLTGQPNAMGGRETGGLSTLLPGYRAVESTADREQIERHWQIAPGSISERPGLAAVELFDALADGTVKAVWIMATNPLVSLPDSARARAALERAELVVVQDAHHPTETSALAHAVLPAAAWPEKEGAMTNSERRVGLVRRALEPPGEALPDWRIAALLAAELGFGDAFAWESEAAVYDEFAACTAGRPCDVSGLSHERLRRAGSVQWPCPAGVESTGTERLYADGRCATPDGRARFAATPHSGPADPTTDARPLTLTTGRVAEHWHTLSRTGKAPALAAAAGEPVLEIHPADAANAGVADGEPARIESARGELVARARLDDTLPRGVAFAPFHWGALNAPAGGGQANAATVRAVDPVSAQPELKAAAVAVGRAKPQRRGSTRCGGANGGGPARAAPRPQRLVVIGTGMAGLETVEELLRRRPGDEWRVTMLGEEPGPAYNRIQLSKLLAGTAGAGALLLRPAAWYAERGVDLRGGSPAAEIDTERRVVRDLSGGRHPYDALVIATGSRPFVPPIPGAELPHVQRFRTRTDASGLADGAGRGLAAVVIGGGLLGLEAAAGLHARGAEVTVVEAADRLMPQQLDAGGAAALERALAGIGLHALTGAGVERIEPGRVTLAGGGQLRAERVVVAAGVRPETTLAREAGIECGRGILVDDALRTSPPSVLAVGECAEHRGVVYGLWAPLAEQARAAGATACGDPAGFHGAVTATTLKVAGVDLFSGGEQSAGDGHDELLWSDSRSGAYRKLVLSGDRLAGAVLVGDTTGARELSGLLRGGERVPAELLSGPGEGGGPPGEPDPEATVCSCNAVTHGTIEGAIRAGGLSTLTDVARVTRATTGCGSCTGDVERLLAAADAERASEHVHRPETRV
ncbi:MAG: molybdopterin-dependent oxidoreductase [Thermoleophilaceae bacterium]